MNLKLLTSALLCSGLLTDQAYAAPDRAAAERVFAEARQICERDNGRLWGRSICGPILIVDYTDRSVLTNQADTGGRLERDGSVYRGVLPQDVIIANTPTEWSGTRWTQLVAPVPTEDDKLRVLIAHELFHRIQPSLGLTRPEAGNQHLDTLEGRYLLQLEWRALARALSARTLALRRAAIEDALAFRGVRYRLFPAAAQEEAALEISEGVPEYTGVKLGLASSEAQRDYALYDLQAFVPAPTFVRSFAYATGPAYGLLLDEGDPAWRGKLAPRARLDTLLAAAFRISPDQSPDLRARITSYDDGTLRVAEVRRDEERRARLAQFQARLIDGPVLVLPLRKTNFQFNPQTLVPLEGVGTIYPTVRLVDEWGSLEVEQGGALVRRTPRVATVTAVGADASGLAGDGWRLTLNAGWRISPGERSGDLTIVGPSAPATSGAPNR